MHGIMQCNTSSYEYVKNFRQNIQAESELIHATHNKDSQVLGPHMLLWSSDPCKVQTMPGIPLLTFNHYLETLTLAPSSGDGYLLPTRRSWRVAVSS